MHDASLSKARKSPGIGTNIGKLGKPFFSLVHGFWSFPTIILNVKDIKNNKLKPCII